MPDVFDVTDGPSGELFRTAAIAAAHELGLFAATPRVVTGHRMRALVDVLAAYGVLDAAPARPDESALTRAGWGVLADVIRRDAPESASDAASVRAMHAHLVRAGQTAAEETMSLVGAGTHLVDLGGGAGAYTAAFLRGAPDRRATLVDVGPVIELAREHLAPFGERVTFVAGDIREVDVPEADIALLANVVHLHGAVTCAALCAVAARAATVVLKDLRMDVDTDGRRIGPLQSLLFALNMAIYTDAGDVHETALLTAWLAAAGRGATTEHRLACSPTSIVIVGRAP